MHITKTQIAVPLFSAILDKTTL